MLNRTSLKVLKALNKCKFEFESVEHFKATRLPCFSCYDINETLKYLGNEGYIKTICNDEATVRKVYPLYKGEHYFEFHRAEIEAFILKSVVTPIIVSLATTLISLIFAA